MRNYIRYIVVLVLIIAGGLLIISVVNKFTEPDVSKVNNNPATEEKETVTDIQIKMKVLLQKILVKTVQILSILHLVTLIQV